MAKSLKEELDVLWSAVSARWKGELADIFYQDYILRLQESAQRQDEMSRNASGALDALSQALSDVESELYI